MVNFAAHIQRYQWPLIGLALIMVQSMPLAVKVVGIIGLCVIALTNHAVLLIVVAATSPLYLMPVTLTDTAAIPLHEIVWGIAILTWVGTRWRQQQAIVSWMRHDRWVGALLGCAVLAVLWALPEGRGEALRWLRWLFVEPIIWYLCVRTALHHRLLHPHQLIQGMMISASAVAGIGTLQALGYDIVPLLGRHTVYPATAAHRVWAGARGTCRHPLCPVDPRGKRGEYRCTDAALVRKYHLVATATLGARARSVLLLS